MTFKPGDRVRVKRDNGENVWTIAATRPQTEHWKPVALIWREPEPSYFLPFDMRVVPLELLRKTDSCEGGDKA